MLRWLVRVVAAGRRRGEIAIGLRSGHGWFPLRCGVCQQNPAHVPTPNANRSGNENVHYVQLRQDVEIATITPPHDAEISAI
jgi:hypothetical protein